MTKRILADYRGHEVEITNLVSDNGHKLVSVSTIDGSRPFYHYCMGGGSYDDSAIVQVDRLDDIRIVEEDPFSPDDTRPEPDEPEYDEYTEWMQMTSELRRGEG